MSDLSRLLDDVYGSKSETTDPFAAWTAEPAVEERAPERAVPEDPSDTTDPFGWATEAPVEERATEVARDPVEALEAIFDLGIIGPAPAEPAAYPEPAGSADRTDAPAPIEPVELPEPVLPVPPPPPVGQLTWVPSDDDILPTRGVRRRLGRRR